MAEPGLSIVSASEGAALVQRLPDILRNGKLAKAAHAPMGGLPAYRAAMAHVLEYVRGSGCVVYGGLAWHALIPGGIYDAEADFVDLDVYSPRPLEDVKALCDMLHERGVAHVNAKNSVHDETYSVYIGSQKCCDVSYMPLSVYRRLPTQVDDARGLRLVHPKMILMDIVRMLVMPAESYWRMDRTLPRALRFFETHGWSVDESRTQAPPPCTDAQTALQLKLDEDAVLKKHAMWLSPEVYISEQEGCLPRVAFVSGRRYAECVERVRRLLRKAEATEALEEETTYAPFLSYLGRSTRFGDLAWVYDADGHGYSCATDARGRTVGTCLTTLYYAMARNLHAHVWNDEPGFRATNWCIAELLKARASGVGGGSGMAPADARFAEFQPRVHGDAACPHHEYFKRNILKTTRCESSIHPYRPGSAGRHGELRPEAHRFRNTSGSCRKAAPKPPARE